MSENGDAEMEALRLEIERLQRENAALQDAAQPDALQEATDTQQPTPGAEAADDWDGAWASFQQAQQDGTAPPPPSEESFSVSPGGGFKFEAPPKTVAGLDTSPDSGEGKLLNLFSAKLTFQVAMAALAATWIFFLYVGLSGGITDGSDRFPAPDETVAQTLADPNYSPPLPPGAWTGVSE